MADEEMKPMFKMIIYAIGIILINVIFLILLLTNVITQADVNVIIMDAVFFIIILFIIIFLPLLIMRYTIRPEEVVKEGEGDEKEGVLQVKSSKMVIYRIFKILAVAAFIFVNTWILYASPFSLFGGSLFGFFMQMIIMVPMMFLLVTFIVNGKSMGLFLMLVASVALFPLSFSFPTLFSNFYVLSTGTSAAAGGTLASNYNVINPMSYYKSSILQSGKTEPVIGPTYEEVTDEVVGVDVSISGRMCDSNDIVATVQLDNEAKYKLSDVFVQFSPIKEVYALELGGGFDICSTDFTPSLPSRALYDTYHVQDLPKGAPATVTSTFQTTLPSDVLSQVCSLRTDVVLGYHTTTVFPISFVDYNSYLTNPVNIGKPQSTSSFGKVRVDMDVGQQPIPVGFNTETGAVGEESVLLKVGWEKKGEGIVTNPKLFLFLPDDLGMCNPNINLNDYLGGSSGFFYTGSIQDSSRLTQQDFICYDYNDSNILNFNSVEDFCNLFFTSVIDVNEVNKDALAAISDFSADEIRTAGYEGLNIPGVANVCEDLVNKGYSLCVSRFNPSPSQVLLCELNLWNSQIDVSEVDMNTYLIRADAIYEFHDVTTTSFTVENCDAV